MANSNSPAEGPAGQQATPSKNAKGIFSLENWQRVPATKPEAQGKDEKYDALVKDLVQVTAASQVVVAKSKELEQVCTDAKETLRTMDAGLSDKTIALLRAQIEKRGLKFVGTVDEESERHGG